MMRVGEREVEHLEWGVIDGDLAVIGGWYADGEEFNEFDLAVIPEMLWYEDAYNAERERRSELMGEAI